MAETFRGDGGGFRGYKTKDIAIPGGVCSLSGRLWLHPDTRAVIGAHLHHPYEEMGDGRWPDCAGGGYVAWPGSEDEFGIKATGHSLVSYENGLLTLSPSLWHRARVHGNSPHRGCHGFIRSGRWEVA